MIRVAVLSFWHVHAKDYAQQVLQHPHTEIAAVWDERADRGLEEAGKLGVPYVEDLDELLQSSDIDAVIVTAPTNMHREVMVKAAQAGKHIFTEKVIAATSHEADEIISAVKQANVKMIVSLPRLNDDYTLAIQDVLSQQTLGKLTLVRIRLSHDGATRKWLPQHFFHAEQSQGGALIDLGCHPMYLVRLFLGMPDSVSASYGFITGQEVEDNAVSVLRYNDGAIAIVEAGFVNSYSPFSIEVHGTEGSLLYGTPEPKLLIRGDAYPDWTELAMPESNPSAFEQWVTHIQEDTDANENITLALDLTKLMEASNMSAREQRPWAMAKLRR